MTPKQAGKALKGILGPILERHGFSHRRDLVFVRVHGDHLDRIGFTIFKDRIGRLRVSFGVGVRFADIEALRGNPNDTDDTPTIGVPMHFLRSPRTYFDWMLADPIDAAEIARNVEQELSARVLPFLEEHSLVDSLRASLEHDDVHEWFTLDSEQRDELLALLDFVQRGKEPAMQRLEDALARRANALAKVRYPLEKLRARLEQQSGRQG